MKIGIKTNGLGPTHAWRRDNGFVADFMCGSGIGPMTTLHTLGNVLIDEAPASKVDCVLCIAELLERLVNGGEYAEV